MNVVRLDTGSNGPRAVDTAPRGTSVLPPRVSFPRPLPGVMVHTARMSWLVALFALSGWLAFGLALAVLMRRRGHEMLPWLIPGLVLGPLLVPYARHQLRREARARARPVGGGTAAGGTVDVLVGTDGSPESRAATHAVLQLLGPRVGRLTLARVISFEAAMPDSDLLLDPDWEDVRERHAAELAELAAALRTFDGLAAVLLPGEPARALSQYAERLGYELLVVGPRGKGLAHALLGSVAAELARHAKIPVLIAGQ